MNSVMRQHRGSTQKLIAPKSYFGLNGDYLLRVKWLGTQTSPSL